MKSKKITTKILAIALIAIMLFGLTACVGESGNGDTHNITYWIPKGEDASYYAEYEENPVIKYITSNKEFNGKKISFDFFVAPPGSEADDFSTLISTGSYCGVMDMSMASSSIVELYEEGIARDLTELVPQHMPNLMNFLKENPQLEEYLYTYVNGEAKILQLRGFRATMEPNFEGFVYRRDWVAKYGKHPVTGEAFTYGFTDPSNHESWQDNVVFPSGGSDPLYISDWEWMFDIFTKAMADLGISDGYCYAPYYLGYTATGDLYSGFGGGAPAWYFDGEKIVYGITNDNMRAYLQCLNTWYEKGWMDKSFDEHTGDMFFAVDAPSVFQGKVGLWQGRMSTVGTQIDAKDGGYTAGAVVYGCRQPINDIYGGDAQKNKEPNMMFQFGRHDNPVMLTDKLSDEEVIAFLQFVDYLYTDEGANLANNGLNKEQFEACQDEFYIKHGYTEGAYYVDDQGVVHTNVDAASTMYNAVKLDRLCVRMGLMNADRGNDCYVDAALKNWDHYENTGGIPYRVQSSVSVEQSQQITKMTAPLEQFLARTIATMIKGETYDVWNDADWNSFVTAVNKYRANEITKIYQDILDSFN